MLDLAFPRVIFAERALRRRPHGILARRLRAASRGPRPVRRVRAPCGFRAAVARPVGRGGQG